MPCGWKGPTPAMKQMASARKESERLRDQRERFIIAAMQGLLTDNRTAKIFVACEAVRIADDTIERMNRAD